MDQSLNIAMILGSIREQRFCDTVAAWAAAEVERYFQAAPEVIDPLHLNIPGLPGGSDHSAQSYRDKLQQADAFVVVVPEYNHSYPAALKVVVDSAKAEWRAKPVGFVSYGGISGGLRAVEHMRQVFVELHGVSVRDSVSFASAWEQFDENGKLRKPERAESAMSRMLAQLSWWGRHLKQARQMEPYEV
ncbi:FMN reductase [Hahella sp. CCB-MM4]|uniref:NADPH-dependent FMN reductase n=1 Tax=Hahella sp. (strain CCB-MM4) TaxID=1926491 RepID=UPI000B9BA837|nr:NAD(P)H-dependent oxidoreductase [Hahella sp. CCB-MM4]OZG73312.1 FMN reductase [Hahella sp. CCB-MM4]